MQSVKKWIVPVWLTMALLNQELSVLLFDQSQILSFTGHAGKHTMINIKSHAAL